MRVLLAAAALALLLFSTSYAQSNRDKDVLVYLQISRANGQGGTIKGTYNGLAVEGTYSGSAGQGSWTLLANGMLVANGTYSCDDTGCVFSGK